MVFVCSEATLYNRLLVHFSLQIAELLARAGLWQPYQDFMKDKQDARQRGRGYKDT